MYMFEFKWFRLNFCKEFFVFILFIDCCIILFVRLVMMNWVLLFLLLCIFIFNNLWVGFGYKLILDFLESGLVVLVFLLKF